MNDTTTKTAPDREVEDKREDCENPWLDAALHYTGLGWRVFPLHRPSSRWGCSCMNLDCPRKGKHPRTKHGLNDATNSADLVRLWWYWREKVWSGGASDKKIFSYPGSNIGIVGGRAPGLVIIDIDPAHGGLESLKQPGPMPETATVRTGSGGLHYYFRYPQDRDVGSLNGWRPGIDIKATGGYVVAPPSIHVAGDIYTWVAGRPPRLEDIAELPENLIDLLPKVGTARAHKGRLPTVTGKAGAFPALVEVFQMMGLCPEAPTVLDEGTDKERVVVLCPNRAEHSTNTDYTSSTVIFTRDCGSGAFCCKHGHCERLFAKGGLFKVLPAAMRDYLLHCELEALNLRGLFAGQRGE